MFTLFIRFLKDKWITTLVYSVAGIGFLWMYVAMFPALKEQASEFNDLLSSYPQGFLDAFGISDLSFNSIENFVGIEHFSIVWPLMVIFLMVGLASSSIAREIEKGTIELVLSRPISRLHIFFSRYFAGLAILLLFTLFSIFAIIPLAELHGVDYQLQNFVTIAIMGYLFAWAVYSISIMFSSFFSEKSKVSMAAGGLFILMYVLNLAANLKESLDVLKYGSFFYYFDYNQAIVKNTFSTEGIIVFLCVIVVCTSVALWRFNTRDIAV